jgi:hypothetical protein
LLPLPPPAWSLMRQTLQRFSRASPRAARDTEQGGKKGTDGDDADDTDAKSRTDGKLLTTSRRHLALRSSLSRKWATYASSTVDRHSINSCCCCGDDDDDDEARSALHPPGSLAIRRHDSAVRNRVRASQADRAKGETSDPRARTGSRWMNFSNTAEWSRVESGRVGSGPTRTSFATRCSATHENHHRGHPSLRRWLSFNGRSRSTKQLVSIVLFWLSLLCHQRVDN